jgi:glycosyltransferase involved in cell wall biosynthesis
MKTELSICIPTFNRAKLLEQSLRMLAPQCEGRPVEICVSNNASGDDTAAVLTRYPQVRSITQTLNIGIDRNIVAALRMATGRYVLPIGDDELIAARGVDAVLAGLEAQPHMLMLNGWRRGKPHLPADLQGRSLTDPAEAFALLWDRMPLGGFAIRREYTAGKYTDRYLGTHHAYSGAAWDYLLAESPMRIDCMAHPVVEFREVPKAWAADADAIHSVEIPRWFDLIPASYAGAVALSRRKYLRTWGRPRVHGDILGRAAALLPQWIARSAW